VHCRLGCDAVWSCRRLATYRRNISPPSSGNADAVAQLAVPVAVSLKKKPGTKTGYVRLSFPRQLWGVRAFHPCLFFLSLANTSCKTQHKESTGT
jgi:hypothetical protein